MELGSAVSCWAEAVRVPEMGDNGDNGGVKDRGWETQVRRMRVLGRGFLGIFRCS